MARPAKSKSLSQSQASVKPAALSLSNGPGLFLFTSNRMEVLADKLAERLARPLPHTLQQEIIVVRNKGMERWLKLQLAERHGICANCEFPFPEAFGYRVFRELLPGLPEKSPVERDLMLWRILSVLPDFIERPEFAPLRNYLGPETDPRRAVQLAGRIAGLFDHYLIFRPAMVLGWDQGEEQHWQAELWRGISRRFKTQHGAALWKQFGDVVRAKQLPEHGLPPRCTIFGVSAVPPYHLDLFAGLSRHLEINLFLLQPSREYWGEITSPRESERILRRMGRQAGLQLTLWEEPELPARRSGRKEPPERRVLRQREREASDAFALHLEAGNRLLASLGYLGRDFLKLLLEAGDWIPDEAFVEPGEGTLLHAIQSDILHLRDRGVEPLDPAQTPSAGQGTEGEVGAAKTPITDADDSIQIHCCHSIQRELEVLHDHLLEWFQRDPALAPRDVVVMTPDIEAYAPLIQAVFGAPEEERRFIPFSVADRTGRRQSQVVDTFLRLLELPETRLGAATVLEILEVPVVRMKCRLQEGDLDVIRRWIEETNIRWGIDASHRERLQLPALSGNTWRDGLDRLLLGFGMSSGGTQLFGSILPHDDVEGGRVATLGNFLEFMDRIFQAAEELREERPLSEWVRRLEQLLEDFFEPTEDAAYERQLVRDALEDLRRNHEAAEYDCRLNLPAMVERLSEALDQDVQHAGFLTGGVTFCGLKPMRSIPFQVICLLGMNDGAFPRPTQHLGFDLMARKPQLGDRSTREDDRYLFLETLLSARQRFYVSYVGQSIRDNSQAPPSVLVSELMDYVAQGFSLPGRDILADGLVTRHRLQPFSEEYFRPTGRLFSYSAQNCQASGVMRAARSLPGLFCEQPLSEPPASLREVTLERLSAFLGNPARFFLGQRLNVLLPEDPHELEEREPFVLEGLENYSVKQELVEHQLDPTTAGEALGWITAAGRLPLGAVGQTEFLRVRADTNRFLALLTGHRPGRAQPLDLALELAPFRLTGRIHEFGARGPLCYRCAALKPKDLLYAWVLHLAANAVTPGQTTTLVGEDEVQRFRAPENPQALLQELLETYWTGLRRPLHFFPRTSYAFVDAQQRIPRGRTALRSDEEAVRVARGAWEGTEYSKAPPELDNPAYALCFRGVEPLDEEFIALARRVMGPLLEHVSKEEA
jgi:exodeoxyribonuclease V gamma subunit